MGMQPNINDIPFLGIAAVIASLATLITAVFTGVNLGRTTRAAIISAERLAAAEHRSREATAEANQTRSDATPPPLPGSG